MARKHLSQLPLPAAGMRSAAFTAHALASSGSHCSAAVIEQAPVGEQPCLASRNALQPVGRHLGGSTRTKITPQCPTEFQRVANDATHNGCATYSLLIL